MPDSTMSFASTWGVALSGPVTMPRQMACAVWLAACGAVAAAQAAEPLVNCVVPPGQTACAVRQGAEPARPARPVTLGDALSADLASRHAPAPSRPAPPPPPSSGPPTLRAPSPLPDPKAATASASNAATASSSAPTLPSPGEPMTVRRKPDNATTSPTPAPVSNTPSLNKTQPLESPSEQKPPRVRLDP